MTETINREQIKKYWDERADQNTTSPTATTNDVYLRELEISTIIENIKKLNLPPGSEIIDIGCGDGYSTIKVALSFPEISFTGIDYSENMIKNAVKNIESQTQSTVSNLKFSVGDVTNLKSVFAEKKFDIAITDRCLINLDSLEIQADAIAGIANIIKPQGYYIAIENFIEGQNNMNQARKNMGLPEIPVRWHNLFFSEPDFINIAGNYFSDIQFIDFSSSYYFATRIIYSAMCKLNGQEPDYTHDIHKIAVCLPQTGLFSPIRMVIMRRKDK